jgi:XTP/dITP diphosphohydrolase
MTITLSSGNPNKIREIRDYASVALPGVSFITRDEAGIPPPPDDLEDGNTFYENALKKAVYAHRPGGWAMADDTSLSLHALHGMPGKDAAVWAGRYATTSEITRHTLARLEGKGDRRATFEAIIMVISPDGRAHPFYGRLEGVILEAERVPAPPGMPYDGIFLPAGEVRVLGEMDDDSKNRISHRGRALAKLADFLTKQVLA